MSFRIKYNNSSDYWDYRISLGCVIYFLASVLNATVKNVFPGSGIVPIMSTLSGIIIFLGYIQCLPSAYRRNRRLLMKSIVCFVTLYVISFILILVRGESADIMIKGSAFLTFGWWIPVGFFASSVYNKQILYDVFLKASYVILVLLTMIFFRHPIPENGASAYNMFFGFNMLIPTLFHINEFFKRKSLFFPLLIMAEILMIFIYANRGCLLPIFFIIVYKIFFEDKKRTSKYFPLVLLLAITIFLSWNNILNAVASLFENYGISSRTLWLILEGDISDSSGRDEIWRHSIEMIRDRPIFGWGLGGEFYRLAEYDGVLEPDNSCNPHNGILQNLVNFGVLGGIVASLIIIRPYFGLRKIKDKYYHDLVLITGSGIIAIFYSSSGFFTNPLTAIFLFLFYSFDKQQALSSKNIP